MNNNLGIFLRSTVRGLFLTLSLVYATPGIANTFWEDLEIVDNALKTNPTNAMRRTLVSCYRQRNVAVELNQVGMQERARRALQYCFDSLYLSHDDKAKVEAVSRKELEAKSKKEYDKALSLTPDVTNGLAIYRECAACHEPEGWGMVSGVVPQIAGQHRSVIIKQLADFRAGNRNSAMMVPYATVESIGGAQAVADVAEYISTLEIGVDNGKGPGTNLDLGAKLFVEHCADCHGQNGEGNNEEHIPRLQAQHYKYLVTQLLHIRDGKRRNASEEMTNLSKTLEENQIEAIADYASRLLPAEELRAPEGWKNPDFAQPQTSAE